MAEEKTRELEKELERERRRREEVEKELSELKEVYDVSRIRKEKEGNFLF